MFMIARLHSSKPAARRYKRGYKNVINKGIELNDAGERCELMMETSGHGALKENRFLDDGAFMAVKIIIEAARRHWQGRQGVKCASVLARVCCCVVRKCSLYFM